MESGQRFGRFSFLQFFATTLAGWTVLQQTEDKGLSTSPERFTTAGIVICDSKHDIVLHISTPYLHFMEQRQFVQKFASQ
mmetsp:Transcript_18509/g.26262  ORF Transcript_18509/g.26262 Transcript_18509/m.26262 type:complete len:80 (-) Transcript_18509:174-413(-)